MNAAEQIRAHRDGSRKPQRHIQGQRAGIILHLRKRCICKPLQRSKATAVTVSQKNRKPVWSTPSTLQTTMGCGSVQGINMEWRFRYEGEELPYQSALTYDEKYHNHIAIDQVGSTGGFPDLTATSSKKSLQPSVPPAAILFLLKQGQMELQWECR